MTDLEGLWRGEDPPSDLPAHLHDTWRQAQHYLALGRDERIPPTRWPVERKKANWATLIARAGASLDSAPEKHPWHNPTSDRLEILANYLVESGHNRDFVSEMVCCLHGAVRTPGLECLADRRWQHWARFLSGHRTGSSPYETVRRPPLPGKLVTREGFLSLLSVCLRDGGARTIRDAAMFVCIYGAAISTHELGFLYLSDWTPEPPALHLKSGRDPFKYRTVALGYEAANLLAGWVAMRGRKPGRMFYSLDKFGAITSEHITGATVHAAFKKRCKQASLSPISPEELRSTGLMRLFECGADSYTVADIAGHSTLAETERYEPTPCIARAPLALHGETPFHKW